MPRYPKQTVTINGDWATRAQQMQLEAELLPEGPLRIEALLKAAMMRKAADMKLALGPTK